MVPIPQVDPNLVYLALVFGLWLGVTAIYLPGTGVLEVLATLVVVSCLVLLTVLPVNWPAAAAVIAGILGFIVIPFIKQRHTLIPLAALALHAVGALFMFNDSAISPLFIGATVVMSLLYYQYALMPIFTRMREQQLVSQDETLIGARGRVVKALNPIGTVNVHGELWTATSDHPLHPGDEVIVVEREGLRVIVEGVKHKRQPHDDREERAYENGYEELNHE
ncbi:MAG: NfeD family protein [Aggregatilineales bacterium]